MTNPHPACNLLHRGVALLALTGLCPPLRARFATWAGSDYPTAAATDFILAEIPARLDWPANRQTGCDDGLKKS